MNIFTSLPRDLQGLIAEYLTVDEISKIPGDIDVLFRIKAATLTDVPVNYKLLCSLIENIKNDNIQKAYFQAGFGQEYMSNIKWKDINIWVIVDYDIFLTKYVDCVDEQGDTLLIYLCQVLRCYSFCFKECLQCIEKLISHGANVNFQSKKDGWTPLLAAFENDANYEIVKMLLDAGAKVLQKGGKLDKNALDLAREQNKFVDLLEKYI